MTNPNIPENDPTGITIRYTVVPFIPQGYVISQRKRLDPVPIVRSFTGLYEPRPEDLRVINPDGGVVNAVNGKQLLPASGPEGELEINFDVLASRGIIPAIGYNHNAQPVASRHDERRRLRAKGVGRWLVGRFSLPGRPEQNDSV